MPEVFYLKVLGTRMTIENKSPPEVEPAPFRLWGGGYSEELPGRPIVS